MLDDLMMRRCEYESLIITQRPLYTYGRNSTHDVLCMFSPVFRVAGYVSIELHRSKMVG
jgi:hypothetical protein